METSGTVAVPHDAGEFVLPDPPATDDNGILVTHWHDVASVCGRGVLEAAARAGESLCEQRDICEQDGTKFKEWCADRLPFTYRQAARYMRIARHWNVIEQKRRLLPDDHKPVSMREALRLLKDDDPERVTRASPSKVDDARKALSRLRPAELVAVVSEVGPHLDQKLREQVESSAAKLDEAHTVEKLVGAVRGRALREVAASADEIRQKHPGVMEAIEDGVDPTVAIDRHGPRELAKKPAPSLADCQVLLRKSFEKCYETWPVQYRSLMLAQLRDLSDDLADRINNGDPCDLLETGESVR